MPLDVDQKEEAFPWAGKVAASSLSFSRFRYRIVSLGERRRSYFFSLLIPLNEIFHVALSYLRMYACSPGTLWGKHPSKQLQQEKV